MFELSLTATFLNEMLNLPRQVSKRVTTKLDVLREDPIAARGDAKKLEGSGLYRVRVGDYRIFYMIGHGWVKLLSVRKRDGNTYGLDVVGDVPPALPPDPALLDAEYRETAPPDPVPLNTFDVKEAATSPTPASESEALPYPLTETLLAQWLIPADHWPALFAVANADDLLNLDIPQQFVERVLDNLFPRPIAEIITQPEYVLNEPSDLKRYAEGDLTAFLLRLTPDQEAMLDFGASGPALVKGGPGTGKSTLAIYRVKRLLDRGVAPILFTTYTNALVRYSEQLLTHLLGTPPEQAGVTVSTIDRLARQYYAHEHDWPALITDGDALRYVEQALETAAYPGASVFDQRVRQQQLRRLGADYVYQEFLRVIEAWGITTREQYLAVERRGRLVPLKAPLREALWSVYETWTALMREDGRVLWEQVRRGALDVALRTTPKPFAALVVDEAQDLSPVALRFLLALTDASRTIYLAADASQSLYQRGFSWTQVHADLNMRGRTLLLRRNFRNTREIAAASARILEGTTAGDAESLVQEPSPFAGDPPTIVYTDTLAQKIDAIHDALVEASRRWRLPIHSGAVLCPSQADARTIAQKLSARGVNAAFLLPKEVDITRPCVKVMTLHSAKGLEFPFVALVGLDEGVLPRLDDDLPPEEVDAILDEQRRLFYVGCTRAMRSLVVCASRTTPSRFLSSLQAPFWHHQELH